MYGGSQESIASNRFSKFDREHAFLSRLRFWSIYSPMGTKILICSKKRVHGRILKNGFAQLIPESLENIHPEGTYFEKISETLFTLPYSHVTYQYLEVV